MIRVLLTLSLFTSPALLALPAIERVSDACGPGETWEWKGESSAVLQKLFSRPEGDRSGYLKIWAQAYQVRRAATQPDIQLLADLAAARAAYGVGWIHAAHRGFSELWPKAGGSRREPIRSAVIQCLVRIHRELPSLDFSEEETSYFRAPQPELIVRDAASLSELYLAFLMDSFRGEKSLTYAEVKSAQQAMNIRGQDAQLMEGLIDVHRGEIVSASAHFKKILSAKAMSTSAQRLQGFLRLVIARELIKNGKSVEAIAEYEKVPAENQWYEEALVELGWANLQAKRYGRAVGAAYNLRNDRGFVPGPLVVAAMAFLETCHYGDARLALRMFKSLYLDSFLWLKEWKAGRGDEETLYRKAIAFTKNPNLLPAPVGYAWIGGKRFLSVQLELNELLEERSSVDSAKGEVKVESTREKLEELSARLNDREKALISRVGRGIAEKNLRMYEVLRDLIRDSQLVWVDSLSKIGEDIASNVNRELTGESDDEKEEMKGGEWKWGKREALSRGNDEVWQDEVGLFQAELKNLCAK